MTTIVQPAPAAAERRRALIGGTLGNMVGLTPAVGAVFGLFLLPLAHSFSWPRAAISGVLGLISVLPALVSPLVGRIADRIGTRPILLFGNVLFAAAIGLLSLTTHSLAQFYLTFALVAVSASLVSTPILAKVVSDWFDAGRGAALGVSAGFGNGFGATLIPVIAAWVMASAGWRDAYLAVAATVLCIGLPTYLFILRDAPRAAHGDTLSAETGLTLREASSTRAFWLVLGPVAAAAGATTAIFSHMVPILDERGVGVATATMVLAIFAMGTAAWQILSGAIFDHAATSRILVPQYLATVVGIVLLEWGQGTPLLVTAAIFLAIGLGSMFSALPYVLGRYFGLRHFGAIMSTVYSAVFVFQGLVPVVLDHFWDIQHSYSHVLGAIASLIAMSGLTLLFLPSYRFGVDNVPVGPVHV